MYRSGEALDRFIPMVLSGNVLDVGSGTGEQAEVMAQEGLSVFTNSLIPPADFICDYMDLDTSSIQLRGIWMSHVLEHSLSPHHFLKKAWNDLEFGGVLAVTVPPMKHEIVGGHLSLWNQGMLLYHLVIAGFDCSLARVSPLYSSGPGFPPYNISVIVRKEHEIILPSNLHYDSGDIEKLQRFFPLPVGQGFNGNFEAGINW